MSYSDWTHLGTGLYSINSQSVESGAVSLNFEVDAGAAVTYFVWDDFGTITSGGVEHWWAVTGSVSASIGVYGSLMGQSAATNADRYEFRAVRTAGSSVYTISLYRWLSGSATLLAQASGVAQPVSGSAGFWVTYRVIVSGGKTYLRWEDSTAHDGTQNTHIDYVDEDGSQITTAGKCWIGGHGGTFNREGFVDTVYPVTHT